MATPTWTDNVSVHAVQSLARNAIVRATLDLRSKFGAYLFARIGRQGTTALTNGVNLLVFRSPNNAVRHHPGPYMELLSAVTAAISTTCAASGNNAGSGSITVASTTSFAVGDYIMIGDPATTSTIEFARVARITSATVMLLDAPTELAHNNTGHLVRNKAEVFSPIWLDGGSTYEIVFDYGDDSAGESVTVEAIAQTLDSVS